MKNLSKHLRRLVSTSIAIATAKYVEQSWRRNHQRASQHSMPGHLSITLTSYPPRFPTLALTLKSLLAQTIRPDEICLWIAETDIASLPDDVIKLKEDGLVIKTCPDLRSYKKIIPMLIAGREDFLLIADDDVYYHRSWLEQFVAAYRPGQKEVLCTRAHRIRLDAQGKPLPYRQWESEVAAGDASPLVFPTGIGGVLYEPGIFHPDVTRIDLFQQLCPTTDDIWLYWMAASKGARFRKIGPRARPINWHNSQHVALAASNAARGTGNDDQIANMIARYGVPSLGLSEISCVGPK